MLFEFLIINLIHYIVHYNILPRHTIVQSTETFVKVLFYFYCNIVKSCKSVTEIILVNISGTRLCSTLTSLCPYPLVSVLSSEHYIVSKGVSGSTSGTQQQPKASHMTGEQCFLCCEMPRTMRERERIHTNKKLELFITRCSTSWNILRVTRAVSNVYKRIYRRYLPDMFFLIGN